MDQRLHGAHEMRVNQALETRDWYSSAKFAIRHRMGDAPKAKFGLMFVVHQVIVLWVVIVSAGILAASALNFLRLLGWRHPRPAYTWLLSGNNFFPCQVALALLLGWILGRALQDRSMLWVWLLPSGHGICSD